MDLPKNFNAPILEIPHLELNRYGDSCYKSCCPVCKDGILLVGRDFKTLELEEFDRCISCGQRIKYLDIQQMRKNLG